MEEAWAFALAAAGKIRVLLTGERFVTTTLACLAFVLAVELLTGRRWRRYRTRTFLTDLTYFFFFTAGVYYFLFSGPLERLVHGLVRERAPFLIMDPWGSLHWAPKALIFIMAIDFFEYCMHRLGHANKWYWKFHCIHHSPRALTPLSKFRIHWGDMMIFGTVKAVPLIMLGHMGVTWMPYLPLMFLQVFSHFDIDFHYGPVLGRWLVSPRYHRVHHSADPAQRNTNFGIIFSCWDYIFGTANADLTKPKAYGCPEMDVPDSFLQQFFHPFLLVLRSLGARGPRRHPAGDAAS
jgi:sterol desaturase/sphingolipid hydroxylase (fatty acid hydroxylase superfamily)